MNISDCVVTNKPKTEPHFLGIYHSCRFFELANKQIFSEIGGRKRTFDTVKQFQHAVRTWENHGYDNEKG